jgi:hypothetical protein
MKVYCLDALLTLDIVTQANHVADRVTRLLHLHYIFSWNEIWRSGSMVAGGAVQSNPVSHAGGFFSLKCGTKFKQFSFNQKGSKLFSI